MHITCLECHEVSTTFQHFQDLLLDIRQASSVEEALESYFSRERLGDGDQAYKCDYCHKRVAATKKFSIERPPKALCVQLKRFGAMGGKNSKHISLKQYLDLGKYRSNKGTSFNGSGKCDNLRYKLVAMVTHLGPSASCGHYTAVGCTYHGSYYLFDDSIVRPLSLNNVLNTNAYILMYEQELTTQLQESQSKLVTSNGITNGLDGGVTSKALPLVGSLPPSTSTTPVLERKNPVISNGGELTILSSPLVAETPPKELLPAAVVTPGSEALSSRNSFGSIRRVPSSSALAMASKKSSSPSVLSPSSVFPKMETKEESPVIKSSLLTSEIFHSSEWKKSLQAEEEKIGSGTGGPLVPYLSESSDSSDDGEEGNEFLGLVAISPQKRPSSPSVKPDASIVASKMHLKSGNSTNVGEERKACENFKSESTIIDHRRESEEERCREGKNDIDSMSVKPPRLSRPSPPIDSVGSSSGKWRVTSCHKRRMSLKTLSSSERVGGMNIGNEVPPSPSKSNFSDQRGLSSPSLSSLRRDNNINGDSGRRRDSWGGGGEGGVSSLSNNKSNSSPALDHLLKLSHRGYASGNVSSWNGSRSEMSSEVESERCRQMKRLHSYDDEIDRGKAKKPKKCHQPYKEQQRNRFQDFQNRKNTWIRNGGGRSNFYRQYTYDRSRGSNNHGHHFYNRQQQSRRWHH